MSTGGGASPVWSVDGRTLYYQQNRTTVYAVDIPEGSESDLGTPRQVFDGVAFAPWFRNEGTTGQFDIDPESQRFIMMEHPAGPDITGSDRDEIRFVVNWFEELKRLAPRGD